MCLIAAACVCGHWSGFAAGNAGEAPVARGTPSAAAGFNTGSAIVVGHSIALGRAQEHQTVIFGAAGNITLTIQVGGSSKTRSHAAGRALSPMTVRVFHSGFRRADSQGRSYQSRAEG
jgi:hypothetical protein